MDSGSRRIIGKVPDGTKPGDVVEVTEAIGLDAQMTRLPGPGGHLIPVYAPSPIPIDAEGSVVSIDVLVANIRLFSKMEDKGARYRDMHEGLLKSLVESRARAANIATPGPGGGMPPGMGGPGGMPMGGMPMGGMPGGGGRFRG